MNCRRVRTARGTWATVPEARLAELAAAGEMTYGCCFSCTRELFGPDPERRPESGAHR